MYSGFHPWLSPTWQITFAFLKSSISGDSRFLSRQNIVYLFCVNRLNEHCLLCGVLQSWASLVLASSWLLWPETGPPNLLRSLRCLRLWTSGTWHVLAIKPFFGHPSKNLCAFQIACFLFPFLLHHLVTGQGRDCFSKSIWSHQQGYGFVLHLTAAAAIHWKLWWITVSKC